MVPQIIFEDSNIIILNKPSGWITNEADTTREVPVVQKWIKQNLKYDIVYDKELRSGIVHRLDKDTSGILILAKKKQWMEYLQMQFKERKVKKSYVALVHGKVVPKEGNISASVGRLPWNRERFGVMVGGRESETDYRVQKYYEKDGEKLSFVEFFPKTGRTHQIRIHAKHIGHPIVSDPFYAGRKMGRKDKRWCPRLFLHAKSISFTGIDETKMQFECKLPADLEVAIKTLTAL